MLSVSNLQSQQYCIQYSLFKLQILCHISLENNFSISKSVLPIAQHPQFSAVTAERIKTTDTSLFVNFTIQARRSGRNFLSQQSCRHIKSQKLRCENSELYYVFDSTDLIPKCIYGDGKCYCLLSVCQDYFQQERCLRIGINE